MSFEPSDVDFFLNYLSEIDSGADREFYNGGHIPESVTAGAQRVTARAFGECGKVQEGVSPPGSIITPENFHIFHAKRCILVAQFVDKCLRFTCAVTAEIKKPYS